MVDWVKSTLQLDLNHKLVSGNPKLNCRLNKDKYSIRHAGVQQSSMCYCNSVLMHYKGRVFYLNYCMKQFCSTNCCNQQQISVNYQHYSISSYVFRAPAQPELTAAQIPSPIVNEPFMTDIKRGGIQHSDDAQDRLFRAHGTLRTSLRAHVRLL